MNLRHFTFLSLLLISILVLPACGSPPVRQEPYDYTQLTELNQRGNTAFERKDYRSALSYYAQALKLSRALDNTPSAATNLISMAMTYRKLKNWEGADKSLGEALALEGVPPHLISEAQFQKALLSLDTGKAEEAAAWAEKSLASCNASGECQANLGARWNLRGRIALLKGKVDEALTFAGKGYEFSRKYNASLEEANAYRLMGQIKTRQKDFPAAHEFYSKALAIDKAKGQSYKLILDLKGLAEIYSLQGQTKEAAQYYQRAYEVAKNSGEEEEAQGILESQGKLKEGLSSPEKK